MDLSLPALVAATNGSGPSDTPGSSGNGETTVAGRNAHGGGAAAIAGGSHAIVAGALPADTSSGPALGDASAEAGGAGGAAANNRAADGATSTQLTQATDAGDASDSVAQTGVDHASVVVAVVRAPFGDLPGVISVRVPQQIIASGRGFNFPLPASLAQAAGQGDVEVTLANGAALPDWLRFDAAGKMFVARQPPAGALPVDIVIRIEDQRWTMTISQQGG